VGDVIVVGSSIADTLRPDAPPGDVRAFDVKSGALRWTFHTIPHGGEPGHETWETGTRLTGAANVWSTITADLARGWVFLPVSTPSPDFYGGDRPGTNLHSDSVVALDARTGERKWHFQTVHHDLWDYDLAAPPVLVTLQRNAKSVDARAGDQAPSFRAGRETGAPLSPVAAGPAPARDVPGERAWPTQPVPVAPPPLVPQRLAESDLYAPTPEHLEACRARLAELRNDGLFTPPSLSGSVLYPFTGGGANWSGAAFDPARQLLLVPVQNLVHVIQLDEVVERATGQGAAVKPLHGIGLRNLWWLLTGNRRAIGSTRPPGARPPPTASLATSRPGRGSSPSISRTGRSPGAPRRASATTTRAARRMALPSRPRAGSCSTPVRSSPCCASTTARAASASPPSTCRPASTPARSATGCARTASSSWWSRPAATSASARRSATR
jgi:hypothetical protein